MISIVTSTYNRKDRLKRAIESVLTQTYDDWEMVVVDDASTDGTEQIVASFGDKRIRYIRRKKNFGNDTRPKNRGIKASSGEYIAFLDDDNVYRPDHLAILVKEMERNPEADVVYGDRWVVDDDGELPARLGVASDYNPSVLMQRNYIDTSDVLIKKEALLRVGGFDERYKKYVDWNLWVRLAKMGAKFLHVPSVITDYHLHKNMKSVTVKDRNQDGSPSIPLGAAPVFVPEWDPHDVEIHQPYLGKVEPPRVAIFTLTYDRLEYTKKTFASLYQTAGVGFDHFVIDNGSTDGTEAWLEKDWNNPLGNSHFHLNGENRGISVASNQALELIVGNYDIVVKVDNDCLFLSDNWLARMVELWKANHMLVLSPYVQGLKDNPGGAPRLTYGMVKNELLGLTRHIGGICHFADVGAYKDFRWDDDSFLHGVQDLELSHYLVEQGYQHAYLENYFVEHMDGTEGQHKRYPAYFERRKVEKTTKYESNG